MAGRSPIEPGLHLGDGVAWLESLPDDYLDGIFTDPPWGSGPDIHGPEVWLDLLERMVRAAERVVRPQGHIMLWYGLAKIDSVLRVVLGATKLHLNAILTVEYLAPSSFIAKYYQVDFVLVFGRRKHNPPYGRPYCKMVYKVVSRANSADYKLSLLHPCARNVVTVGHILRDWFAPGMRIADPFAGTDTTGYQARRLGLECWSWEVDPVTYRLALERHKQMDLFVDW
jgi:DNA modification methylase